MSNTTEHKIYERITPSESSVLKKRFLRHPAHQYFDMEYNSSSTIDTKSGDLGQSITFEPKAEAVTMTQFLELRDFLIQNGLDLFFATQRGRTVRIPNSVTITEETSSPLFLRAYPNKFFGVYKNKNAPQIIENVEIEEDRPNLDAVNAEISSTGLQLTPTKSEQGWRLSVTYNGKIVPISKLGKTWEDYFSNKFKELELEDCSLPNEPKFTRIRKKEKSAVQEELKVYKDNKFIEDMEMNVASVQTDNIIDIAHLFLFNHIAIELGLSTEDNYKNNIEVGIQLENKYKPLILNYFDNLTDEIIRVMRLKGLTQEIKKPRAKNEKIRELLNNFFVGLDDLSIKNTVFPGQLSSKVNFLISSLKMFHAFLENLDENATMEDALKLLFSNGNGNIEILEYFRGYLSDIPQNENTSDYLIAENLGKNLGKLDLELKYTTSKVKIGNILQNIKTYEDEVEKNAKNSSNPNSFRMQVLDFRKKYNYRVLSHPDLTFSNEQMDAILKQGKSVIAAGAGSGKTRVLAAKVAHCIADLGIPGSKIIATSFSDKSSKELLERCQKYYSMITGSEITDSNFIGKTTHSVIFKLLKPLNIFSIPYKGDDSCMDILFDIAYQQIGMSGEGSSNISMTDEEVLEKQTKRILSSLSPIYSASFYYLEELSKKKKEFRNYDELKAFILENKLWNIKYILIDSENLKNTILTKNKLSDPQLNSLLRVFKALGPLGLNVEYSNALRGATLPSKTASLFLLAAKKFKKQNNPKKNNFFEQKSKKDANNLRKSLELSPLLQRSANKWFNIEAPIYHPSQDEVEEESKEDKVEDQELNSPEDNEKSLKDEKTEIKSIIEKYRGSFRTEHEFLKSIFLSDLWDNRVEDSQDSSYLSMLNSFSSFDDIIKLSNKELISFMKENISKYPELKMRKKVKAYYMWGAYEWLKKSEKSILSAAAGATIIDSTDCFWILGDKLRDDPEFRKKNREKFESIMVDEAQDLNFAQHRVFGYLAGVWNPETDLPWDLKTDGPLKNPARIYSLIGDDKQCVSENTLISTSNGYVFAKDIKAGDLVLSFRNGKIVEQTVNKAVYTSWLHGYKVITEKGHSLIMSPNHKIWSYGRDLKRHSALLLAHTENGSCVIINNSRVLFDNYRDALYFCKDFNTLECIDFKDKAFELMLAEDLKLGFELLINNRGELISDKISSIEIVNDKFIDLDVNDASNFFGNNILSHNSIYSWRGSDPKEFKDRAVGDNYALCSLDTNYRSGKLIVEAANRLIANNGDAQIPMECKPGLMNGDGKIYYNFFEDYEELSNYIIEKILDDMESSSRTVDSYGVVVRNNSELESIEPMMWLHNKDYYIRKSLLNNFILRIILDWVILVSSNDVVESNRAFMSCLRNPYFMDPRELYIALGKSNIPNNTSLVEYFTKNKISIFENPIDNRQLENYVSEIVKLQKSIKNLETPYSIIKEILQVSSGKEILGVKLFKNKKLKKSLEGEDSVSELEIKKTTKEVKEDPKEVDLQHDDPRIQKIINLPLMLNIRKLLNSKEYLFESTEYYVSLKKRLESKENESGILLSTAHSWKGLERDVVFVVMNEHFGESEKLDFVRTEQGELTESELLEVNQEQRRLGYVAITRGKSEVIVVCSKKNHKNKECEVGASSYILEMGLPTEDEFKKGITYVNPAESYNEEQNEENMSKTAEEFNYEDILGFEIKKENIGSKNYNTDFNRQLRFLKEDLEEDMAEHFDKNITLQYILMDKLLENYPDIFYSKRSFALPNYKYQELIIRGTNNKLYLGYSKGDLIVEITDKNHIPIWKKKINPNVQNKQNINIIKFYNEVLAEEISSLLE